MANKPKVEASAVISFLSSPRTVKEVAAQFAVTPATAKKHLVALVAAGQAVKVGTRTVTTKGRPADQFSVAVPPTPVAVVMPTAT